MTQEEQIQASALIDTLGGTGEVARLCKISAPSISGWRKRGIPHPWLMFFRARYPSMFDGEGALVAPEEKNPKTAP